MTEKALRRDPAVEQVLLNRGFSPEEIAAWPPEEVGRVCRMGIHAEVFRARQANGHGDQSGSVNGATPATEPSQPPAQLTLARLEPPPPTPRSTSLGPQSGSATGSRFDDPAPLPS